VGQHVGGKELLLAWLVGLREEIGVAPGNFDVRVPGAPAVELDRPRGREVVDASEKVVELLDGDGVGDRKPLLLHHREQIGLRVG